MPYAKNKIRVMVPKRSGFDKSHRNSGTMSVGTLTPILCDELIPGSRFSLKNNIAVQLPPLVSDTYMNLKLKVEAFFVPGRLLCGSYEDWFCDFPKRIYGYETGVSYGIFKDAVPALPVFTLVGGAFANSVLAPGSLADYLGFKAGIAADYSFNLNPLPFIAYHLIWQEWYRNPRVQNPCFSPLFPGDATPGSTSYAASARLWNIPSYYFAHRFGSDASYDSKRFFSFTGNTPSVGLADGHSIFELRQRNFGLDYFTGARVSAQQGPQSTINIELPEDPNDGASVSIAQIRAANSLQQFRERNNIPSPRMTDQVKARYNANLSDGVAQRPICIGSASYDVSTRGIDQTGGSQDYQSQPFSGVGAQYGRGFGLGSDYLVKDFTANEPGYVMVLASLVPEVTYSSGVAPMFKRYQVEGSITEMAVAQLQNMGDEPVFASELNGTLAPGVDNVFGYQDRFASFMFKPNEAHGLMRDGQSLSSFVLQRSFSDFPELSTSFLEIPKNYLDQVLVANSQISGFSAWYDTLLEYHVSMPLAEFSLPSLQDPAYEHGESVVLTRNGQIF